MTTREMAEFYRKDHLQKWKGKPLLIYNPHNRPEKDLPIIYGFNNGGEAGFLHAQLLAEDGTALGAHICTHETYMPYDLGLIEGASIDHQELFRKHYPNGYKTLFLTRDEASQCQGLNVAHELNQKKRISNEQ